VLKEALLKPPYIVPNKLVLSNDSSEETRFVDLSFYRCCTCSELNRKSEHYTPQRVYKDPAFGSA